MKKIMNKFATTKARTILTSLMSLTVMTALSFPDNCFFFFYEPDKPEGISDINLKDLLPKKN